MDKCKQLMDSLSENGIDFTEADKQPNVIPLQKIKEKYLSNISGGIYAFKDGDEYSKSGYFKVDTPFGTWG